jgi:hypothetical protein
VPVYRFQLKSTGKTYEMPWDDEDTQPTSIEKKQYAWEQDNKGMGTKAWEWANEPLTDLPSRGAKVAADAIDKPTMEEPARIPFTGGATWKGLGAGLTQGVGDVATSLTSPLSLALMAAGPVAKVGGMAGKAADLTEKGLSGALALHGGYKAGKGVYDGKLGDIGAGVLEMAGGGLGLNSAYGRAATEGAEAAATPRARRAKPQPPMRKMLGEGTVREAGPSSEFGPKGVGDGIIDAEFTENPGQGQLPGQQGLKGIGGSRGFYTGRKGVSPNIGDVTETGINARTPAEAAFNASVPERFKPNPSNTGTTSPYDYQPQSAEGYYGKQGALEDVGPVEPPKIPPIDTPGPYAKETDANVSFLAEHGDTAAREEALKRPSLRGIFSKIMGEHGAVGDIAGDPLNPANRVGTAEQPGATDLPRRPAVTQDQPLTNTYENKSPMRVILDSFKKLASDEKGMWKPFGSSASKTESPTQGAFSDWVNARRASKIEGILKKKSFKDLDALGQDGILDFQAGIRDGRLADVAKYFDDKFSELTKGGVKLGYRDNYLPQMWENDPEEVKNLYARLGLKPSFTMQRVFENYEAGINHGLKPKFQNLSDLLGWYEGKANKALADRKFYDYLKTNNLIKPKGQAPNGWESLDPDHFPSQKFVSKNKVLEITMQAPPEVARIVNNYLRMPVSELDFRKPGAAMQWFGDKASLTKNMAMSAGIPYTGVNAHGFNILARTVMGNPKEAFTAGKYLLNPKSAGRFLDEAMATAPWAVKHGLTLTTEGHEMGVTGSTHMAGRAFQGFLKKQGAMFEDPLFQNIIPALKLKHFNDMTHDMVRQGMGNEAAGKSAAEFTNNLYGGINWDAMGRSRELGNVMRIVTLAPDWLASNARIGQGMAKALLDPSNPQGRAYGRMARNIIGSYVAANVVNHALSGHSMWENEPGHALDIEMGRSDGKVRWLRPFGTAADFLRLPFDAASAAFGKGDLGTSSDVVKNRLSIPARVGLDLVTKRDRFNRPMLGQDDYGRPIPVKEQIGGAAGEVSSMFTPPYVKSMIDLSTGRTGTEEALMGMGEMPFRYTHIQKRRGTGRRARK